MPLENVANMTTDDIATMMQDNCILVEWVDHLYAYGLCYLSEHLAGEGRYNRLLEDVDDEHIPHLGVHGCPPTIHEWDGWWIPLSEDLTCIQLLMAHKETTDFYCMDDSLDWVVVGGNTYSLFICQDNNNAPTTGPAQPTEGGSAPPLSSQAIAVELPFAPLSGDQVMADILGMPQDGSRDPPLRHVAVTDPHGQTGATLRDETMG
jgi:hypothetical protein